MRNATIPNSTAATTWTTRSHIARLFERLMRSSPADQSATPPPNDGTLASSPAALPATSRLSPSAKTMNPAGDIVAAAEESDREQRRGDDQSDAVDHPEDLPERISGHERAADAERRAEDQADDGDDVVTFL